VVTTPPIKPPVPEAEERKRAFQEQSFARMLTVFSVASGMVGVCITAISLILVVEKLSAYQTLCDTLLVLDSFFFLGAALFSFAAMRLHFRRPWRAFMVVADVLVILGMICMVVVCGFLVTALL
jgi:hypothetical protein